jgi:hypothetical protein
MRAKDAYDEVVSIADRRFGPGKYWIRNALGEVLFSLIIVLTITLTASLTTAEDQEGLATVGG